MDPSSETLGVNFMEKTLSLPQAEVTLSLWDLGGERSFLQMLPMVSSWNNERICIVNGIPHRYRFSHCVGVC